VSGKITDQQGIAHQLAKHVDSHQGDEEVVVHHPFRLWRKEHFSRYSKGAMFLFDVT
jgi:hypothetical protein